MKQFVTCHSHPDSLDSGSTPKAFAAREVELGGIALTGTDHGSLASSYQIYELAKKNKLIPIIGLEGYFRDDDCPILKGLGIKRTDTVPKGSDRDEWRTRYPNGTFIDYCKYHHITLGFQDHAAYLCAVRLLSKADLRAEQHGSERKPLFDWSDLEELAAHNVTATSSCLIGMVQRHLMNQENGAAAKAYFERLKHLFKDRFYAEVFPHVCTHNFVKAVFINTGEGEQLKTIKQHFGKKLKIEMTNGSAEEMSAEELAYSYSPERHKKLLAVKHYWTWEDLPEPAVIAGCRKVEDFVKNECRPWSPDGDIQAGCNRYVLGLAKKYNVPVLIGDDSHFAHPEEKPVQDVRLSQGGGNWKFHNSYHRQSTEEAWEHFRDVMGTPQDVFEGWVDNSYAWAEGFKGFKFDTKPSLPTKFYPSDTLAHTKHCLKHHGRVIKDEVYMDRLRSEIDLLHRNGVIDLLPYFFIDEEICRFFENQGILTGPGRGSAAGMLFAYDMGITHVDPIKYGLSKERFITETRIKSGKLPDIDQDLPGVDLLVGCETDVVEFSAEDGTLHIVPETLKVETDLGLLTIREAVERGADVKPWWLEKAIRESTDTPQQP